MSKTIEIGPYSAYAIAVKYGYEGTEEDWIKAVEAARKSAETSAANAKREADGASTSAATATEQARIATKKAGDSAASADASASSASAAATSEANAKKYSEEAGAKANTDKTLSVENAPADAAAVGDIVLDPDGNAIFYSKAETEAKIKEMLAAQREEDLARIKFWASNDPTSPASFIGGTWEQIKDCFILAAGDTYAAGTMGGEAEHSLTGLENGSHSHEIVAFGNDDWHYKTASALGTKFQASHHVIINDISAIVDADESAGYLATNYSGTGQPHNNMPPYITKYVWQRIE